MALVSVCLPCSRTSTSRAAASCLLLVSLPPSTSTLTYQRSYRYTHTLYRCRCLSSTSSGVRPLPSPLPVVSPLHPPPSPYVPPSHLSPVSLLPVKPIEVLKQEQGQEMQVEAIVMEEEREAEMMMETIEKNRREGEEQMRQYMRKISNILVTQQQQQPTHRNTDTYRDTHIHQLNTPTTAQHATSRAKPAVTLSASISSGVPPLSPSSPIAAPVCVAATVPAVRIMLVKPGSSASSSSSSASSNRSASALDNQQQQHQQAMTKQSLDLQNKQSVERKQREEWTTQQTQSKHPIQITPLPPTPQQVAQQQAEQERKQRDSIQQQQLLQQKKLLLELEEQRQQRQQLQKQKQLEQEKREQEERHKEKMAEMQKQKAAQQQVSSQSQHRLLPPPRVIVSSSPASHRMPLHPPSSSSSSSSSIDTQSGRLLPFLALTTLGVIIYAMSGNTHREQQMEETADAYQYQADRHQTQQPLIQEIATRRHEAPRRPAVIKGHRTPHPSLPSAVDPLPSFASLPVIDTPAIVSVSLPLYASLHTDSEAIVLDKALSAAAESLLQLDLLDALSSLRSLQRSELVEQRVLLYSQLQQTLDAVEHSLDSARSEITMNAPMLSQTHDSSDPTTVTTGHLSKYLTGLQRQYDYLMSTQPAERQRQPTEEMRLETEFTAAAEKAEQQVNQQVTQSSQHHTDALLHKYQQLKEQILHIQRLIDEAAEQQRREAQINEQLLREIQQIQAYWDEEKINQIELQQQDLQQLSAYQQYTNMNKAGSSSDSQTEGIRYQIEQKHALIHHLISSFSQLTTDTLLTKQLHHLSLACLALDTFTDPDAEHIHSQEGFTILQHMQKIDPVIGAAIEQIPIHIRQQASSAHSHSDAHLQSRYSVVEAALTEEAFVPISRDSADDQTHVVGRSIWAQLIGKVFSLLYSNTTPVEEKEDRDLQSLHCLSVSVSRADWLGALSAAQSLSPRLSHVCADWTQLVHERALLDSALQVIKARISCLCLNPELSL